MNPFDVAVIAILVVSALFAFVRGFLKEALSILVWVGAAVIAYFAYPFALPLVSHLTTEAWLAQAGTMILTFVLALILLALVSSTITSSIRGTALGPIDRLLGLLYGLARGAVVVCLVYLGMTLLIAEPDRPVWFTGARSLPTLARGAELLETVLPSGTKSLAVDTIDAGKRVVDPGPSPVASRPILPSRAPADPLLPTPPSTPAKTAPGSTGSPGELSESERLMRPPASAVPVPAEKPNYRNDDRKAMDRTFQSVQ